MGIMEKDCVYVVWQKEQEKLLVVSVCSNCEGKVKPILPACKGGGVVLCVKVVFLSNGLSPCETEHNIMKSSSATVSGRFDALLNGTSGVEALGLLRPVGRHHGDGD